MRRLLILNGPNLNKLGSREPEIYGTDTLSDIENMCRQKAQEFNFDIDFRQTNNESQLIEWIQDPPRETLGLIINAAAFTHTSLAIHDALKMCGIPTIEVHLSNPAAREEYRHFSYISPVASGVISGFGAMSYDLAVCAMHDLLNNSQ